MKKTGWCQQCLIRIGQTRFRQLIDGERCVDCCREFPAIAIPQDRKVTIAPANCDKSQSQSQPQLQELRKKEIKLQEELVIQAFDRLKHSLTNNWHATVAKELGWEPKQVSKVVANLRGKGLGKNLIPQSLEERLLEKLKLADKPMSVYELAEYFPSIDVPWIGIKMSLLTKKQLVERSRKPAPYLYKIASQKNADTNS